MQRWIVVEFSLMSSGVDLSCRMRPSPELMDSIWFDWPCIWRVRIFAWRREVPFLPKKVGPTMILKSVGGMANVFMGVNVILSEIALAMMVSIWV